MQRFLKEKGILPEFSSPYIHEQNGRAEREIRTLVESARSMLHAKKVDKKLWSEAVNTACYILNRTILKLGDKTTPFEKWFNRKPTIKHLRIFGSRAYLNVPKEKRHKFDPKSKPVIFIGYDGESTNCRLWDNASRKVVISSDVTFDESAIRNAELDAESLKFIIEFDPIERVQPIVEIEQQESHAEEQAEIQREQNQQQEEDQPINSDVYQPAIDENIERVEANENAHEGRQLRDRNRLRSPNRYGIPVVYLADTVPMTYHEAVSSDNTNKWKNAMDEEVQALTENHIWTLCDLPKGKRAI